MLNFDDMLNETKKVAEEYTPYAGPTGPEEEQVVQNNAALQQALGKIGIVTEIDMEDFGSSAEEAVQVVRLAPGISIGYDRWGFVGDPGLEVRGELPELDQGSLEDAVAWAQKAMGR